MKKNTMKTSAMKKNVLKINMPKINMLKTNILIVLFLLLSGGVVFASGGEGKDASTRAGNYDIGKKIFFEKLYCDECPLSGVSLDQQSIALVMPRLKSKGDLGKLLSYRQRYAVKYFLKRRFDW